MEFIKSIAFTIAIDSLLYAIVTNSPNWSQEFEDKEKAVCINKNIRDLKKKKATNDEVDKYIVFNKNSCYLNLKETVVHKSITCAYRTEEAHEQPHIMTIFNATGKEKCGNCWNLY